MIFDVVSILTQAVLIVFVVDLLGGIFHWLEDTFFTVDTPFIGKFYIQPNDVHHVNPKEFLKYPSLYTFYDTLVIAIVLLVLAYFTFGITWQLVLFCVVGALSNQFHRWSHLSPSEVPSPVMALQKIGILQSAQHHAQHHRGEKNTHYCVVTPYVNVMAEKVGFFRKLEQIFVPIFGAPRREDLDHLNQVYLNKRA